MSNPQAASAESPDLTTRGETRELALKALMTAHQFLTSAEQELPRIVQALERRDVESFRTPLSQLLEGLGALSQLASDLHTLAGSDPVADDRVDSEALAACLHELVAKQEAGDWPGAGAVLEARIEPLLGRMRRAFDRRAEALQTA
jgi:hypothetical protein